MRREQAWYEIRWWVPLAPVVITLALLALTGCAADYYDGEGVHVDRYGQAWERCYVRRAQGPTWCRVPY